MTHLKNPTENNDRSNETTTDQHEQEKSSKEVELPTPEKKNDDITTSNSQKADKGLERAGKLNTDVNDEETGEKKTIQAGFDVNNTGNEETRNEQRKDKRGDETEKLERDKTTDPKTKDADWQQDKMNEANNQQGSKVTTEKPTGHEKKETDKEGSLKDTRNDSILDRPKTETYEKNQDENIGAKINKENYTHSVEEGKRDEQNRKQQSIKNDQGGRNDSEKRKFERHNKEIN